MAKAVFIDGASGQRHEVEVPMGMSLMQAAVHNNVPGIVGQCGGVMSCGTCHCHVEPEWTDVPPPVTETEDDMLDFADMSRNDTSRLSCQIVMTEALDGIEVIVPR